jgi:hypothetical protein
VFSAFFPTCQVRVSTVDFNKGSTPPSPYRMPDTMLEYTPERRPDRMSEHMSDRMPESMSGYMMPDRISE